MKIPLAGLITSIIILTSGCQQVAKLSNDAKELYKETSTQAEEFKNKAEEVKAQAEELKTTLEEKANQASEAANAIKKITE